MFYVETRKKAREFCWQDRSKGRKVTDLGSDKPEGRRWAVKVL